MQNFFVFLLLIFFVSCSFDPSSKSLEVYNESDNSIYVFFTYKDSLTKEPKLELFLKQNNGINQFQDSLRSPDYRVNPHSYSFLRESSISSKKWIPYPDKDYVNFFFIKEATLKDHSWEEIVMRQLYEKKIRYTYKELEKLNYKIIYKP